MWGYYYIMNNYQEFVFFHEQTRKKFVTDNPNFAQFVNENPYLLQILIVKPCLTKLLSAIPSIKTEFDKGFIHGAMDYKIKKNSALSDLYLKHVIGKRFRQQKNKELLW